MIEAPHTKLLQHSRQGFSVMEKRILFLIIRQIRKHATEQIILNQNSFGDFFLELPTHKLLKHSDTKEHIHEALKLLCNRSFEIQNQGSWEFFSIITQPMHLISSNDCIQFCIPHQFYEIIIQKVIKKNYSPIEGLALITLQKDCSRRLYEFIIINQEKTKVYLSIEDLRIQMHINTLTRYDRWSNIDKDFLSPGCTEIKNFFEQGQSKLYFTYTPEAEGRNTIGVWLNIFKANE